MSSPLRGLSVESHQRIAGAQAILVSEMADAFALFRSFDYRRGDEDTGMPGQIVSVSLRGERSENPHGRQDPSSWAGKGQGLLSSYGRT